MHRSNKMILLSPCVVLVALLSAGGGSATALGAAPLSAEMTCQQLTKAQIQPLMATPITSVKVTSEGLRIKAGETSGQQCSFSGAEGRDVDVLVDNASLYAKTTSSFQQQVADLQGKVRVPGVGSEAYREKGDFQIIALQGDEECSISVGSGDTIPGVAALQEANNGHSELPEAANAIIARALGTICNRLYKQGNTKPSLAGLSKTAGKP